MIVSETIAAMAFYTGVVAFCLGAILRARSAVERKPTRYAIPLLIVGGVGIAAAVFAYAHGPRSMLPF